MPCREGAKEFYDIVVAWTKFWSVQNCNNYMWHSLVTLMNVCRRSGEGGYEYMHAEGLQKLYAWHFGQQHA